MSVIEQALRQARNQSRTASVRNPQRPGEAAVECRATPTLTVALPLTAGAGLKLWKGRQSNRPWVVRVGFGIAFAAVLTGVVAYDLLDGPGAATQASSDPAVQWPAQAATIDNGSSRSLVKSAEQSSLEVVPNSFRTTGVIVGDGTAFAVVNGLLVRVGDRVDGAVVVAIAESAVRLRQAGREFDVPLDR